MATNSTLISFLNDVDKRLIAVNKSLANMRKVGAGSHQGAIKEVENLRDALKNMVTADAADKVRKQLSNVEKQAKQSSNRIAKTQLSNTEKVRRAEDVSFKRRVAHLSSISGRLYEFFKMQMLWYPAKAVTFKLLAVPSNVIRSTAEYTDTLAQLSSVAQMLPGTLDSVDKTIIQLSRSTKFSATEIGEAAKQLAQAGFTGSEMISALKPISLLATATASSIGSSTSLISTVIRAFKISTSEISDIADVLANAVTKSRLTIDSLNESFSYVASAAAQAGVSYKDTVAELAILANAGMKSSTASTGLRMSLLKMIAPTKQAKKELEKLGLTVDDVSIQTHGLEKVLQTLGKLSSKSLVKIFSARSANAILALTGAGKEARRIMRESLDLQGIAANMAAEQLLDLKQTWKNLGDTVQTVAIGFGSTFSDEIAIKIRAFKNLLIDSKGSVTALGKSIKLLIDNIGSLTAIFLAMELPKLFRLGAILDIKLLSKSLKELAASKTVVATTNSLLLASESATTKATMEATTADVMLTEANIDLAASNETVAATGLLKSLNLTALAVGVVIGATVLLANHFRKLAEEAERANTQINNFIVSLTKAIPKFTDIRIEIARVRQLTGKVSSFMDNEAIKQFTKVERQKALKLVSETKKIYEKAGFSTAIIDGIAEDLKKASNLSDIQDLLNKFEESAAKAFSPINGKKILIALLQKAKKDGEFKGVFKRQYQQLLEDLLNHMSLSESLSKFKISGSKEKINAFLDRIGWTAVKAATKRYVTEVKLTDSKISGVYEDFFTNLSSYAKYQKGTHAVSQTEYTSIIAPLKANIDQLVKYANDKAKPELKAMRASLSKLMAHIFVAPDTSSLKDSFATLDKTYSTFLKKLNTKVKQGQGIPSAIDEITKTFVATKVKKLAYLDNEIKKLEKQRNDTGVDVSAPLADLNKQRVAINKSSPNADILKLQIKQSKENEKLVKSGREYLKVLRDTAKLGADLVNIRKLRAASIDKEIAGNNAEIATLKLVDKAKDTDHKLNQANLRVLEARNVLLEKEKEALPLKEMREDWKTRKKTYDLLIKGAKIRKDDAQVRSLTVQELKAEITYREKLNPTLMTEQEQISNTNILLEKQLQLKDALRENAPESATKGVALGLDELQKKYKNIGTITENFKNMTITLNNTMESSFSSFFESVTNGTKNLSDAFATMVDSIRASIIKIMSDMLAQQFMKLIVKSALSFLPSTPSMAQGYNSNDWVNINSEISASTHHKGGIVGAANIPKVNVDPRLFLNAPKLHKGLAADEFPAILQKGEQVIPKNQVNKAPKVTLNVINNTKQEVNAQTNTRWDGKEYIINTILTDIRRGGPLRGAMAGAH